LGKVGRGEKGQLKNAASSEGGKVKETLKESPKNEFEPPKPAKKEPGGPKKGGKHWIDGLKVRRQ